MRSIFLDGKDIFLSPLSADDNLEDYVNWLNDQDTTLYMGSGRFPVTREGIKSYIEKYNSGKDGMLLGVFLKESSKHIGNITLHNIDWRNSRAEIGIIIGDKSCRGKGYATEAISLIAKHAFERLNLNKLCAGMEEGNEPSKRAFEKAGFKVEGVLRRHFYLNGLYRDSYRMGLLREEFKGK